MFDPLCIAYLFATGCLADMEYQLCGLQLSCNNFSVTDNYNNPFCESGCFCSNKHVLEDGMCIHPDTCPGKFYCTYVIDDASLNKRKFYHANNIHC